MTTPINITDGRPPQLLREVIDLLPAYVAYVDTDLRYVVANRTYMERFGRPEQEIVGQLVSDVTGPAFRNVAHHLLSALAGETQHFEPQMVSVDGYRTLSVTHLPHRDHRGNVSGVIIYGFDITEQRRAEAALLQSEKLAAVGRLAASIAHEINNPLASVTNLLYLIRKTFGVPSEAQQYVEIADRELRRVAAIANQTLRFYKQTTKPTPCRAPEMFGEVIAVYQGRLVNSAIEVVEDYRSTAPIRCFDGEIRQVLSNLVVNAIDAMPTGGRLTLRTRDMTDVKTGVQGVKLTIADSGTGMPATVQQKIFEAFYTTKGLGGTGLGLWLSKEIVDRHSGTLRVRSSQGHIARGTVFTLFLPLQNADT